MEQYAEDFEGFLVTEKRDHQLDTLEGETQRTVKEWYTFIGQPTEYGDNILLQAIALHLKKTVQVFSYDSKSVKVMTLSGSHTSNTNSMGPPTITTSYQIRCTHVV